MEFVGSEEPSFFRAGGEVGAPVSWVFCPCTPCAAKRESMEKESKRHLKPRSEGNNDPQEDALLTLGTPISYAYLENDERNHFLETECMLSIQTGGPCDRPQETGKTHKNEDPSESLRQ